MELKAQDFLADGRNRASIITTMLEIELGPGFLGAQVSEELGETFDDGHWNRWLVPAVYFAKPMTLNFVEERRVLSTLSAAVDHATSNPDHGQLAFASTCYRFLRQESSPAIKFLVAWTGIEALLDANASARSLSTLLSEILHQSPDTLAPSLDRLEDLRSKVSRGEPLGFDGRLDVDRVRIVLEALIQHKVRGGILPPAEFDLGAALWLPWQPPRADPSGLDR
ncbi:hypothetical protein ACFQ9V_08805 [Leifsonia sp. NPDC056665]|uniref:hypothetical protein n=1 Tax=Leifsonia sp. NPDC056665 TaxID=3345901 RepID=UPI0036CB0A05